MNPNAKAQALVGLVLLGVGAAVLKPGSAAVVVGLALLVDFGLERHRGGKYRI